MELFYQGFVIFLFANLTAALWRAAKGPSVADRLTAAQLFGTTGVAILLVLAEVLAEPALRNVALAFALLAVMVVVCFLRTGEGSDAPDKA